MVFLLADIVQIIFSVLFFIMFFHIFMDFKDKSKKYYFILKLIVTIVFLVNTLFNIILSDFLILFVCIIFVVIIFESNGVYKLFVFMLMSVIAYSVEIILRMAFNIITGYEYTYLADTYFYLYDIYIDSSHLLLVAAFYYIHFKLLKKDRISFNNNILTMLVSIILFVIIMITLIYSNYYFNKVKYVRAELGSMFTMFTLVVCVFLIMSIFLINQLRNSQRIKDSKNQLLRDALRSQSDYYIHMDESNQELKKIKHDMNNHLCTLEELIDQKKYNDVTNNLDTLRNRIDTINNVFETGNKIFDAILNDKMKLAKKNNISINFIGKVPKGEFIEYLDLCTICANSLDNAIEYIIREDSDNRIIEIESEDDINYWSYKIKNILNSSLEIKNNKFESSKKDKKNHGFGISNIKEAVSNNSGSIDINAEGGTYSLNVVISKT